MKKSSRKAKKNIYESLMKRMEEVKLRATVRAVNVKRDVKGGEINAGI